ncbi:hypothetical protein [Sphingobium sp. CFD-1]|uniref:hypothetical protein n=1 Tax=Sphingobium sp. CFD-1 TaxID=2878545 RepID=UPI00214AF105|nr:hypothetical protein [Sphingobium sp. CFD-1]
MTKYCESCRFWMRLSDEDGTFTDANFDEVDEDTGQCRFNPPTAVYDPMAVDGKTCSSDGAMTALWPVTWDRHWCGQHQPRLSVAEGSAA